MRKFKMLLAGLIMTATVNAQVYQLPNGDFELPFEGNGEPPNWNSFVTSNCTISIPLACGMAQQTQHLPDNTSNRPAFLGTISLQLYSRNVMGINANGIMTTGRMNAGSTDAGDPSNNTQTIRSNASFRQSLDGRPDSLVFWTKYVPSSGGNARIRCFLHGNNDFRDPPDAGNKSMYQGYANLDFPTTNNTWVRKAVPFVYDGTNTDLTKYVLITLTTCSQAGGCSNSDNLHIDNIEFVYTAWLQDIKIAGNTIQGFSSTTLNYTHYFNRGTPSTTPLPTFAYTKLSPVATVHDTTIMGVNGGIDSAKRILTVTSQDGLTVRTYTVNYVITKSSDKKMTAFTYQMGGSSFPVTVPTQSPDSAQQNIYISFPPGTTDIPIITATTLSDTGARAFITQTTSPKVAAVIKVRAEDGSEKLYNIRFSVIPSANASLDSIYYDGVALTGFDSTNYSYSVTLPPGTFLPPLVSAVTVWRGLTPNITQPQALPGTATIVVTAEDGVTQKTYTVSFSVGISTNNELAWVRYNGLSVPNFHRDTLHYTVALRYGMTSATVTAGLVSNVSTISIVNPTQIPGTATITVTAQDVTKVRVYTIDFLPGKNNNADLLSMRYTLGTDTLPIPNFNPLFETYHIVLPTGTTQIPQVLAVQQDPNATINFIQPALPKDMGYAVVTAEDGVTIRTYKVIFTVALSHDATLSQITVDGQPLIGFNPLVTNYTIALDDAIIPTITAQATHAAATYQIIYPLSVPGQVQIVVKAEDTTTIRTYRLNLSLASGDNPDLLDLGYMLGSTNYAIENFHKDTLKYYVVLPSLTVQIPVVSCQVAAMGAYDAITQPTSPNGGAIVIVTSQDSSKYKIYQIYFSVEISDNAKLSELLWDGYAVVGFNPNVLDYTVELPYNATIPVVNATAQSIAAQVSYQQAQSLHDSAIVFVTAENNINIARYVIHFDRQLSPIATLSDLRYRLAGADSTIVGFTPMIEEYIVDLKEETEDVPQLLFSLTDNKATATLLKTPQYPNDTALIMVVAENLTDTLYYSVIFQRLPSTNAKAGGLQYDGIFIPNFHPDTLNYSIVLDWAQTQIPSVAASKQWGGQTLQISQASTVFGTAQVRVVAENGTLFTSYFIHFIRGANVDLQELGYTINGVSDSITGFLPEDTIYQVIFPIGTTDLATVDYVLEDSRSTVNVTNITEPTGEATIEITAWDGSMTKTYRVQFVVELSTEAVLTDLQIDGQTIDGFASDSLDYARHYPYGYAQLPVVTATASQPDARIVIEQVSQLPQKAIITVYAGDTNIKTIYIIDFTIEAGNNLYLSAIYLDSTPIVGFVKNVYYYDVELPYGTSQLPNLWAVAEDSATTVTVTPAAGFMDTAYIETESLDGSRKTYAITFFIGLNSDATLRMVYVDGNPLPNFSSGTYNYPSLMLTSSAAGTVTAITSDSLGASYEVIDTVATYPKSVWIHVTASDNVTKITYRIRLDKNPNNLIAPSLNEKIAVYPNPVADMMTIEIYPLQSASYTLYIHDELGKIMDSHSLRDSKSYLSLSHLLSGTYFYKITTNNQTVATGKFVKQ